MATADSSSVHQGQTLTVSAATGVLHNDADGDTLHASLVSGPAHAASFSLNASGALTYAPGTGFAGVDKLTYQAGDGALNSNTATVYLGVSDTAPTATCCTGGA